ncbi:MAG: hypothetical protein HW384_120, partial [Dehalococcoidia bacterium]|nr:hypothetical protein [Dehalococcoidia bacterium]
GEEMPDIINAMLEYGHPFHLTAKEVNDMLIISPLPVPV